MKSQIWQSLKKAPILRPSDMWVTILPFLAWAIAFYLRPFVMDLDCMINPDSCSHLSVFKPDRYSLGLSSSRADNLSFLTQNWAAYLAVGIPLFWALVTYSRKQISARIASRQILTDWLILAQVTLWNGLLLEITRLIVQRPRPFVYADPLLLGNNPAHYTSFYSGHTSFAAAAGTTFVFCLLGRNAPAQLVAVAAMIASVLVFLTGVFRVLAGRHFITDVLTASIVGTCIGLALAYYHRPRSKELIQTPT